jgi:hypothetical protein
MGEHLNTFIYYHNKPDLKKTGQKGEELNVTLDLMLRLLKFALMMKI